MSDVRFKGLGRYGDGPRKFIEDQFGFSPTKSGNDLIISDRQAARAFAGVNVLHIHPRLQVAKGEEWELANRLYAQIPEDVKKYQIPPPKSVQISSEYGFISVIERAGTMLAIVPDQEVAACLAQEVIPVVSRCYGAKYVTGVSVNAHYQQVCISFSRSRYWLKSRMLKILKKYCRSITPLEAPYPVA